jgi:hypothetical protein
MMESEPGFLVLGQAIPAIDWSSFSWLEGTSHSLPHSEQTTFVIFQGPKFFGPPKLLLSMVLLTQFYSADLQLTVQYKNTLIIFVRLYK